MTDSKLEIKEEYPICPITQEPIKVGGMTCLGGVYEKNVIEEWFQDHDTDPLTNCHVPSKFVTQVHEWVLKDPKWLEASKQDRFKSTRLWCPALDFQLRSDARIAKISQIKQQISSFESENKKKWDQWQQYKKDKLISTKLEDQNDFYISNGADEEDRPKNTGKDYQCINLSSDKPLSIRDRAFKCSRFDGAILNNLRFYNCSLARTSWCSADLRNCVFWNCSFVGDEVCFSGSITDKTTMFIHCEIEPVGIWSTVGGNQFLEILNERGLKGEVTVRN